MVKQGVTRALGNSPRGIPGRDVVVYCVYGHEVGRRTALHLKARGIHARFLRGGIDAWAAAGLPLESKRTG